MTNVATDLLGKRVTVRHRQESGSWMSLGSWTRHLVGTVRAVGQATVTTFTLLIEVEEENVYSWGRRVTVKSLEVVAFGTEHYNVMLVVEEPEGTPISIPEVR